MAAFASNRPACQAPAEGLQTARGRRAKVREVRRLLLEDVSGKTVLPIGRQGAARAAIEGDLAAQLRGIEHAAGVRRSL
jgi:hypothetical protein